MLWPRGVSSGLCKPSPSLTCCWKEVPQYRTHHKIIHIPQHPDFAQNAQLTSDLFRESERLYPHPGKTNKNFFYSFETSNAFKNDLFSNSNLTTSLYKMAAYLLGRTRSRPLVIDDKTPGAIRVVHTGYRSLVVVTKWKL